MTALIAVWLATIFISGTAVGGAFALWYLQRHGRPSVFADLNGRDENGYYGALVSDADKPVTTGGAIIVRDDEGSRWNGRVQSVGNGVIRFSIDSPFSDHVSAALAQAFADREEQLGKGWFR